MGRRSWSKARGRRRSGATQGAEEEAGANQAAEERGGTKQGAEEEGAKQGVEEAGKEKASAQTIGEEGKSEVQDDGETYKIKRVLPNGKVELDRPLDQDMKPGDKMTGPEEVQVKVEADPNTLEDVQS